MTVRELIQKLLMFEQDLDVMVFENGDGGGHYWRPPDDIEAAYVARCGEDEWRLSEATAFNSKKALLLS